MPDGKRGGENKRREKKTQEKSGVEEEGEGEVKGSENRAMGGAGAKRGAQGEGQGRLPHTHGVTLGPAAQDPSQAPPGPASQRPTLPWGRLPLQLPSVKTTCKWPCWVGTFTRTLSA